MKKQRVNPYLPSWEYIPDGEPYVFNGRVYVYGSHDRFNGHAFCLNDYVCWSAPVDDLSDWRYEGVIYKKTDDPLNPDGSMCLYAPTLLLGQMADTIYTTFLIKYLLFLLLSAVRLQVDSDSMDMSSTLMEPVLGKEKEISRSLTLLC